MHILAEKAEAALSDNNLDPNDNYPDDPGVKNPSQCSRFCRSVTHKAYGNKYRYLFGGTAIETGRNMLAAGLGRRSKIDLANTKDGSLVFHMSGSGGYGHIAILQKEYLRVAENSYYYLRHPGGAVSGCKGHRELRVFGSWDLVAYLPDNEDKENFYHISLSGVVRQNVVLPVLEDGHAYIWVRDWARVMGFEVFAEVDTNPMLLWFNGKQFKNTIPMRLHDVDGENRLYVYIVDAVNNAGLQLSVDGPNKIISIFR